MASKKVSKDIRNFASDLYDYIWTKHTFSSKILEKNFVDKFNSTFENRKVEKRSYFTRDIGEAVLSSQYLLRSYCNYCFTQIGKDFTHSHTLFNICVYNVIFNWIHHRSDTFCMVLDSAAIIAEAILFSDAVVKITVELIEAPEMFINFFESYFKRNFFQQGGWEQLNARALESYSYFEFTLENFNTSKTYKRLKYNCDLIKQLSLSPVMFPVECCVFCEKCTVLPNDKVLKLYFDSSVLAKLKHVSVDDCFSSSEVWQKIESEFKNLCDQNAHSIPLYFECRFLGGEEKQTVTKKSRKKRKCRNRVQATQARTIDCSESCVTKKEQGYLQSEIATEESELIYTSKIKTGDGNFPDAKKTETLNENCERLTKLNIEDCVKSAESYRKCMNSAESKIEDCVNSAESIREEHETESKNGGCVALTESKTEGCCGNSAKSENCMLSSVTNSNDTVCLQNRKQKRI